FETLGFALGADCVRCAVCRKKQRALERSRREYERLLHLEEKTWQDYLNLAHAALDLVEDGKMQVLDRIRGFVKKIPEFERHRVRYQELVERMAGVEPQDEGGR